jgi:CIC family chloride channel protein
MVFLVLENSDNLDIAFATVLSVLVASTFVRLTFGYSFSTWRFHLRGLPLHGAQDIGWVSALTAARLMRSDFTSVPLEMSLGALRQRIPLGSRKWIFGVTKDGRYGGIIDVAAVHDPEHTEIEQVVIAADMTTTENCYVLPYESISTILKKFEACESEILAVVQSQDCHKIIGSVSEAFCLKRYSQELEQRRSYDLGMK